MQAFFDFLNNPMVKTILMFVLGLAAKKWPSFVNKFIPLALVGVSGLLTFLQWVAGAMVPAAHAFVATAAPTVTPQAATVPWWQFVLTSVFVPVLIAVGTHSAAKNTREGLK
jgi:hypothetical protein